MAKRYRKRAPRRKKGSKRPMVNINRSLQPFAQRYVAKLKYSEVRVVSGPVGGGLVQYNYRLNSINDPNLTGGGHQPYGHDELAALYNRYRVFRVDYAISALNSDGSINYSVVAAMPANEQVATFAGVADIMESPRTKFITQAPNAALKVLKGSIFLPSLTGRTAAAYLADDRYQAEFFSNPLESLILNVMAGTITGTSGVGGTATNTMNLQISLVYHVECFDSKHLLPS